MTREQFESLDKEQQEEVLNTLLAETEAEPVFSLHVKCKPTYNFQSIEFEWDLTDDNFPEMLEWYHRIVSGLQDIAPEQPDNKKPASKGPKATASQIALLKKLGVQYDKDITAKEASKLIDKYFEAK